MIVGAGKSEMCRAGQQAGNSDRSGCCHFESETCRASWQTGNSGRVSMLQY